MTILNILKFPHKNLSIKADKVIKIDHNIKNTINNIITTMFHYKGLGLSATQVNINYRIIVLNVSEQHKQPLIMINPKIIDHSTTISIEKEGCLSFNDIFIKIKRYKYIKVKFVNIQQEYCIIKTNNLLSRCIQHEIDHLNGVTLYNKMSRSQKIMLKKT